jgi:hypothetical protein
MNALWSCPLSPWERARVRAMAVESVRPAALTPTLSQRERE